MKNCTINKRICLVLICMGSFELMSLNKTKMHEQKGMGIVQEEFIKTQADLILSENDMVRGIVKFGLKIQGMNKNQNEIENVAKKIREFVAQNGQDAQEGFDVSPKEQQISPEQGLAKQSLDDLLYSIMMDTIDYQNQHSEKIKTVHLWEKMVRFSNMVLKK